MFFDYYADLAQELGGAHFDKSRPQRVEVLEFLFDAPDRAQVLVRFQGQDGRPLRPGRRVLLRTDRWQREEGAWFIRPGGFRPPRQLPSGPTGRENPRAQMWKRGSSS